MRTLAARLLLGVLTIVIVTLAVGGYLYIQQLRRDLAHQYQQRAVSIASTVAGDRTIQTAVLAGDPDHVIQRIAEQIRHSSGASYVVVTDRFGLRYSHPDPSLIGQRLQEPVAVLDGRTHVGTDHGNLGLSANGKAPIMVGGQVVGQVSVGILEREIAGRERHEIAVIVGYSGIALVVGALGALLLARRIKRITFGLEPSDIAALLQDREAMLHGIREGVVGLDPDGRITVLNAEAERLLQLTPSAVGQPIGDLVPPGRLRDVLVGAEPADDTPVLTEDFLLVVNRVPTRLRDRVLGSVVTLRDRTEYESAVRELRNARSLTDALRAQEHEYANRLHVMSGLLELGESAAAASYLAEVSDSSTARADEIRRRIASAPLAALLIAKTTVAAEKGIRLVLTEDSLLAGGTDGRGLVTIVGNLVDNAIEAVAGRPDAEVTVHLDDADGIHVVVTDNGPGIARADRDLIFTDGFTSKSDRRGHGRGLGLALVRRIVRQAGGRITVGPGPGARFDVWLPADVGAEAVRR